MASVGSGWTRLANPRQPGLPYRGRRWALSTLKHALHCLGQPTSTSWNHDAPPSARPRAAKARRRLDPPTLIPDARATSRHSSVLTQPTSASSPRVVSSTFLTRVTSRHPVVSIPAAARIDCLLCGVCDTRSMRPTVEDAYPGFRKLPGLCEPSASRPTDRSVPAVSGRWEGVTVGGRDAGPGGTAPVRRSRECARPRHCHRAPPNVEGRNVVVHPSHGR